MRRSHCLPEHHIADGDMNFAPRYRCITLLASERNPDAAYGGLRLKTGMNLYWKLLRLRIRCLTRFQTEILTETSDP